MKYFLRILIIVLLILGIVAWRHCNDCGLDHTGAWEGGWLPHIKEEEEQCRALEFDGVTDWVNCGDDNSLDFGDVDFSISCWFKTSFNNSDVSPFVIKYDLVGATTPYYMFGLHATEAVLFTFRNAGNVVSSVQSPLTYDDGIWHHAVGIRDTYDNKLYLYVDGGYVNQGNDLGGSLVNGDTLQIGAQVFLPARFYTGIIDEVMIYRRALDSVEIAWLHNNCGRVYNDDSLVLWLPMNEGTGDTTFDYALSNDGLLGNGIPDSMPIWTDDEPCCD